MKLCMISLCLLIVGNCFTMQPIFEGVPGRNSAADLNNLICAGCCVTAKYVKNKIKARKKRNDNNSVEMAELTSAQKQTSLIRK